MKNTWSRIQVSHSVKEKIATWEVSNVWKVLRETVRKEKARGG